MFSILAPTMYTFTPNVKPAAPNYKFMGDIAPTGFFDPLKLSNEKNSQFLREAELQHGRAAMLASVIIPVCEMMKPDTLGINYFSDMDFNSQLPFWYSMACLEFYRMYTGWNSPFVGEDKSIFKLNPDYQPGNLLRVNKDNVTDRRYNAELSNGRLAMLAAAHMIGSELATGNPIVHF
jgi:hypothetical protein